LFGGVVDGVARLSGIGEIVRDEWLRTADVRASVKLDEFVVMPNHFHAIFWIIDPVGATLRVAHDHRNATGTRATHRGAPTAGPPSGSVGAVIGQFKSVVTKRVNSLRDNPGCPVWQRNYYEHVIRDDHDLVGVRQYILDNPAKWESDINHPGKTPTPVF
jgi:REP element-mobilizing transposase RayT